MIIIIRKLDLVNKDKKRLVLSVYKNNAFVIFVLQYSAKYIPKPSIT